MKFTHQLKLNAVPEWKEHYINYARLKKLIYNLSRGEAAQAGDVLHTPPGGGGVRPSMDESRAPLLPQLSLPQHPEDGEKAFEAALDHELQQIVTFYMRKESDLKLEMEEVHHQIDMAERAAANTITPPPEPSGLSDGGAEVGGDAESGVVRQPSALLARQASQLLHGPLSREARVALWANGSKKTQALAGTLKARLQDLYIQLLSLREFLKINREGFRKILKKHDKMTDTRMIKDEYMRVVDARLVGAAKNGELLESALNQVLADYAVMFARGDLLAAEEELRGALRDEVEFERNTVWRDMVALERRTAGLNVKAVHDGGAHKGSVWLHQHKQQLSLALAIAVFMTLLYAPIFGQPEKQNCLALLAFVSILWCTEAIPLFVTSMLVPLLVVVLRVLKDDKGRLEPSVAAKHIFNTMFSQVIMLLLGGFAIAAALSKHFIAKQLAIAVISKVGRKPHNVLLANMLVATFASMWISNVAAPVLCFSIVQPILRTLDPSHAFAKSLVMGIALASNLGGMTSPIASPQNIFAVERMSMTGEPPSWLAWFAVALPVAFIGNIICWAVILMVYRPGRSIREVRPLKPPEDPMNKTQYYVIFISLATVTLWCLNTFVSQVTGEMGVLAILPLVAFFGFGVLSKDDFNGFLWNVVMLAMGGLALGEAVKSSGLLLTIAQAIQQTVAGMGLWSVLCIFCALVLVGTTFISHTVGAMVILPIVQSVGEQMTGDPHPKLLVMGAALMCSGAMGLPVSGFPNMNAVALEDSTGQNYVSTADFLRVGVPGSVATYGVIVTLGYALMRVMGF